MKTKMNDLERRPPKLTKVTVKRINKYSDPTKPGYIHRISVIGDILFRCNVLSCDEVKYVSNDGNLGEHGGYKLPGCSARSEYDLRVCCGMYARYPDLIYAVATYGQNYVEIMDANTLVRKILQETVGKF